MRRIGFLALWLLAAAAPAEAGFIASVQPVAICLDDGSDCAAPMFDAARLQDFWLGEADLQLDLLPLREFHSTAFHTLGSEDEAGSLLLDEPDPAGPTDFTSSPITVWFAVPSFPLTIGLAIIDANRVWVSASLDRIDQTSVLAHELGHAFGLRHVFDPLNLMAPLGISGVSLDAFHLSAEQVAQVQASRLVTTAPDVVATPAPGAVAMFGLGLAALAWRRRQAARCSLASGLAFCWATILPSTRCSLSGGRPSWTRLSPARA